MSPETEKRINANRDHQPLAHDHPEHPAEGCRKSAFGGLRAALAISLGLVLVEFLGAILSGSLALLADAFHVLSDALALAAALFAGYLATRLQSPRHSYGYYRVEVLAALLNSLVLIGVSFFIVNEAIERWGSDYPIDGLSMFSVALLGFIANLWMLYVMHKGGLNNLNLRAAFLHVAGDTFSSIAVIVGSIGILAFDLIWPDLVASFIVSSVLLVMAARLSWEAVNILLEGTPKHLDPNEIRESMIRDFPEILSLHDFHVWEITSHLFAMTAHIEAKLENLKQSKDLIDRINYWVKKRYGIGHTTFQIEPLTTDSLPKHSSNH